MQVNIHNLAGHSKVKQRNEDFKRILSDLQIFNKTEIFGNSENAPIDNFDIIFMMGDMNYRIDSDYEYIIDCINNNKICELTPYDQLLLEIEEGYTELVRFSEGTIEFPPTYKYIPGSHNYYYDGEKIPGWCDRILYSY